MKLSDAIIVSPDSGMCKIDINIVCQCFDKKTIISRWHDTYKLCRTRYSHMHIKVEIKKEDAIEIINHLDLKEVDSVVFKNSSYFELQEDPNE